MQDVGSAIRWWRWVDEMRWDGIGWLVFLLGGEWRGRREDQTILVWNDAESSGYRRDVVWRLGDGAVGLFVLGTYGTWRCRVRGAVLCCAVRCYAVRR